MSNINYLSKNLNDFGIFPDTIEFKKWGIQAATLDKYIQDRMEKNEMISKSFISRQIIDSLKILYDAFKNITGKDLYLTAQNKENIQNFLKDSYKTYSKHYPYQEEIFIKLLKLEYFLLISRNKVIYKGQFKIVAFYLLFRYFKPWEEDVANNWQETWIVTYNEINNLVSGILEKDLQELLNDKDVKNIRVKLQIDNALKEARKTKMTVLEPEIKYLGKKPLDVECLTDLWKGQDNQITQRQKLDLIMVRYGCSLSAATRYMKKFGLWQYREKKNPESSETEKQKTEIVALKNRIKELEEENRQLKQCKSISVQSDIDENDIPDSSAGKINILNNNIGFNHITADTEGLDPDMLDDDILVKYQ